MTEPHAVRLNDLLDALDEAGRKLDSLYTRSTTEYDRTVYFGGMAGLFELRNALTPAPDPVTIQPDAPGARPADGPVEAPTPGASRSLWDELDALKSNLRAQAHYHGATTAERRIYRDVANRIGALMDRTGR